MANINYNKLSQEYLIDLVNTLYNKEYFSYKESAINYVEKLRSFISDHIDSSSKHKAPAYFNRYGKNLYYVTYRPNRKTTWYIFFMVKDDRYLIRYITNNHVKAHHIRGLR